ncbi:AAA family ATPase [Streptomyces uncialis]|uniref:AAA family ATPase n=1 Tax=Streptomyces uncialis TaxID=1048205 RepID=UPI0037F65C5C
MSMMPPPVRTGRPQQTADEYDDGPFSFRPATKDGARARVSIQGVSGSGKTWTGLSVAHGLAEGARFAVIDTERGAASLYIGERGIRFDVLQMHRYDPRDLVKALAAAAQAGYGVVMVDSLSHFWKGTDGTLDQVEKAKSKYGGNSFAGWKDGTPMQNDMVEALLSYPGHVVVTMRSQTEWVLQENDRGRKEPVMVGLRAEQRKGIEYEFGVAAEMDISNRLRFLKSRCPALHQKVLERPDGARDIARPLLDWLRDGAQPVDSAAWVDAAASADATAESLLALYREVEAAGALATPLMHPESGEPTSLGAFIKERGTALKHATP